MFMLPEKQVSIDYLLWKINKKRILSLLVETNTKSFHMFGRSGETAKQTILVLSLTSSKNLVLTF